ncbi:hypothetical protein [Seonamhaeicola sp.]|uniref:hypothetical protein n=1 Tax=Seonamhaeicola sp. TaxID=1912245 RepID=UPI00261AF286|nr:hypothetical protein [Seonamhaeicola sp.]
MRSVIAITLCLLLSSCLSSSYHVEEIGIKGKKALLIKKSKNSKAGVYHFLSPKGEWIAFYVADDTDITKDCNWCLLKCYLSRDSDRETECLTSCEQANCNAHIEKYDHQVNMVKVKNVSIENLKLFEN